MMGRLRSACRAPAEELRSELRNVHPPSFSQIIPLGDKGVVSEAFNVRMEELQVGAVGAEQRQHHLMLGYWDAVCMFLAVAILRGACSHAWCVHGNFGRPLLGDECTTYMNSLVWSCAWCSQVLDMAWLHGCTRLTLAVLYEDVKQSRHVKTYEVRVMK